MKYFMNEEMEGMEERVCDCTAFNPEHAGCSAGFNNAVRIGMSHYNGRWIDIYRDADGTLFFSEEHPRFSAEEIRAMHHRPCGCKTTRNPGHEGCSAGLKDATHVGVGPCPGSLYHFAEVYRAKDGSYFWIATASPPG